MQNKIVIRYADGRVQKGVTADFFPNKQSFHILPVGAAPDARPLEAHLADAKAVFFVKEFDGNPGYKDRQEFEPGKPVTGRKIQVKFKDGELMIGTTNGYQPGRPGFFVSPADTASNIERCFVMTAATSEVKFI